MRRILGVAVLWSFFSFPLHADSLDNSTCLACHGQKGADAPFVDENAFGRSIHGKNLCVSCHADVVEVPHARKPAPVSCARCHRVESQIYLNSDHGRAVAHGKTEAASCKDCHGHSHTLLNSRDPKSPVNRRNIPATCAHCHDNPERMARTHLTERNPVGSYNHTVHGEAFAKGNLTAAVCSDCHGTHDLHGSLNPASRVYKTKIPDTCGRCHQNVASVYKESIHGQAISAGIKEAPVCTDCHGEHTIRSPKDPQSSVYAGAVTKTCSGCHASERLSLKLGLPTDRLKTYLDTYHGLAYQRGDLRVANCASCHGFHDVLPSSDPRSSINPANIANTCGRCHPGAGQQLTRGYVHSPPTVKHWVLPLVKRFYLWLIALVIGFMLLHNGLDLLRKMLDPPAPAPEEFIEVRLTVNERWQHALLMISFCLLAYSGFALKFPDAGWAQLLAPFAEETRRSLHRWTALVFCVLGFYHVLYLAVTRRGRIVFKSLLPVWHDAKALGQQLAYSLGWRPDSPLRGQHGHAPAPEGWPGRKEPPKSHGTYHYPEKMEYWALVWGSIVMVTTGALLIFNNFTLKHFPAWISDLATMIHYYEAVLACLAILVWHFYLVIFDPKVYPMNWAWLTGLMRRRRKTHEKSEEKKS